jgi:molybdate transport system substrate-binding protein
VVNQVIAALKNDAGIEVIAEFGAVGAINAKVLSGVAADVVVLTDVMIEELIAQGVLAPGRHDLGRVGTGVAVRAGAAKPAVAQVDQLHATLRGASVIVFPDPAIATAGKIVMSCLDKLDLSSELKDRIQCFPNGNAAMNWLAAHGDARAIGITQNAEILPLTGVDYIAPLPDVFQAKALYSAGRMMAAGHAAADQFISRLTSPAARLMLQASGFEF